MPKTAEHPKRDPTARPRPRRGWFKVALLFGGCFLAGWLGGKAGRYFQFTADDFRPAPPPHTYVSGPTYLDADVQSAPAGERGT